MILDKTVYLKVLNSNEFMAYKINFFSALLSSTFSYFLTYNKCDFENFPPFFFKSKINLLSAKKAEKIADNKAQFELTIAYFHVFQGKKKTTKSHLLQVQAPNTNPFLEQKTIF